MVGVAQLVEHQVVALVAVGSNPIAHPKPFSPVSDGTENRGEWFGSKDLAPVAQLDRAPDFESVGRRFESCRAYQ